MRQYRGKSCLKLSNLIKAYLFCFSKKVPQFIEVGRAFLIHFQKKILNKVFLMIRIARELKFYTRMVTSGSISVERAKKC